MAAIANITVKKSDGTTDIVYDALAGSGGDSSPAAWRQDTGAAAGLPVGLRASLKMLTKWNGPKTARQASFEFVMPYAVQDSTTTKYSASDRVVLTGVITMPQAIPKATLDEGVYQAMNLLASALIKSSTAAGYAPT